MFCKQWRFAGIKICNFACFGAILDDEKCSQLLSILNIPIILRTEVMQSNVFQCNVFIFENKRRTGYDKILQNKTI